MASKSIISTAGIAAANRSHHWHHAIAETYFPLDLQFVDSTKFNGELLSWNLGAVSLSRLTASGTQYRRLPNHLRCEGDEQFLVTIPICAPVYFSQCGQDVHCKPGGFILERSDEPYEFSHAEAADLWVLKVDGAALNGQIRAPDRFCSLQFNAKIGVGGLFADMVRHIPTRFDEMGAEVHATIGQQLIDLLVLSLQSDKRTLTSANSSVRAAHLTRIESFVRNRLGDSGLDPETIATACGISTRYLHQLFRDTGQTLGQWIRDQRLAACRGTLKDGSNRQTIAEIAYANGFNDQAQFSRAFRNHYNVSPKDFRLACRRN